MMDLDSLRRQLADAFPSWSRWIDQVKIEESPDALPVDNDGRNIYCNQRLMRYYTPETQRFYLAQQLLHLRLNHAERGRNRDRIAWKRASDAVVNQMLRKEGMPVIEPFLVFTVAALHLAVMARRIKSNQLMLDTHLLQCRFK